MLKVSIPSVRGSVSNTSSRMPELIRSMSQSPLFGEVFPTHNIMEHVIVTLRVSIPSVRGSVSNRKIDVSFKTATQVSIPSVRGSVSNRTWNSSFRRDWFVSIPSVRGSVSNLYNMVSFFKEEKVSIPSVWGSVSNIVEVEYEFGREFERYGAIIKPLKGGIVNENF